MGQKLYYFTNTLLPQLFWIAILPEDSVRLFGLFVLYFMGMMTFYELGYFANDYLAQKREKAAGMYVRKKEPPPMEIFMWLLAIGLRLLFLTGVVILASIRGAYVLPYLLYLVLLGGVFAVHNAVLGRKRVCSFFSLYYVRMQLPVITVLCFRIVPHSGLIVSWEIFSFIYALFFSISYGIKKTLIGAQMWFRNIGAMELALIPSSLTMLLIGVFLSISELGKWGNNVTPGEVVLLLAAVLILSLLVQGALRFIYSACNGFIGAKNALTHTHTDYSHDGNITKQIYRDWLLTNHGKKVYLTDHSEDLSRERYEELKLQYKDLWPHVVPGLEYSLNGSHNYHILTHNLSYYISLPDGIKLEKAIAKLQEHSERILWAHPLVSLRRLIIWSYWKELLSLLSVVDGIEIFNKKYSKLRFIVMGVGVSFLANFLYGRKALYIGHDAHKPEELP